MCVCFAYLHRLQGCLRRCTCRMHRPTSVLYVSDCVYIHTHGHKFTLNIDMHTEHTHTHTHIHPHPHTYAHTCRHQASHDCGLRLLRSDMQRSVSFHIGRVQAGTSTKEHLSNTAPVCVCVCVCVFCAHEYSHPRGGEQ
jgi:hypothetical protein